MNILAAFGEGGGTNHSGVVQPPAEGFATHFKGDCSDPNCSYKHGRRGLKVRLD